MPNLPILTASSTCTFSQPVTLIGGLLSGSDAEYSRQNCVVQYFVNSSSTQKIPVSFSTPTTSTTTTEISSSSDFYIDPVFTGDGILMFFIGVIFLTIVMIYSVYGSLSPIKTKKTYLQYNGGDVEIRDDN